MSIHNFMTEEAQGRKATIFTAATTMTLAQLQSFGVFIINNASGVAITVPAASAEMAGMVRLFTNKGAGNSTVVVAAGFGGAGSGTDTDTLARGDMAILYCDGSSWYSLHHTTGA